MLLITVLRPTSLIVCKFTPCLLSDQPYIIRNFNPIIIIFVGIFENGILIYENVHPRMVYLLHDWDMRTSILINIRQNELILVDERRKHGVNCI